MRGTSMRTSSDVDHLRAQPGTVRLATRVIVLVLASLLILADEAGDVGKEHTVSAQGETSFAYIPYAASGVTLDPQPLLPGAWVPDAEFVIGGQASTVEIEGDIAFVGIGAHLVAMDVSGSGDPIVLGASPPFPGNVADLAVRGRLAVVAVDQPYPSEDRLAGLFMIDVSDPSALKVIGHGPIVGGVQELSLSWPRVLVLSYRDLGTRVDGFEGISLWDVSDPRTPVQIGAREDRPGWYDIGLTGNSAYVCAGSHLLVLASDSVLSTVSREEIRCFRLAINEAGNRMATFDGATGLPHFRIFELSESGSPELLGEIYVLEEPEEGFQEWAVEDIAFDGDTIWLTGSMDYVGGLRISVDASDPSALNVQVHPPLLFAGYGIDASAERIVAVGARIDPTMRFIGDALSDDVPFTLGSDVAVYGSSSEPGAEAIGRFRGPGSVVGRLIAHDERAFFIDRGPSYWIRGELEWSIPTFDLWELDISEAFPRSLGVVRLDSAPRMDGFGTDIDRLFESGAPGAVAAAEHAVFLSYGGRTQIIDVRAGSMRLASTLPVEGVVMPSGRHLFAASGDGMLRSFDTSDPDRPIEVSSLELPYAGPSRIAGGAGTLWLAPIEPSETAPVTLVDVRDPARPSIVGTVETIEGGFTREVRRMVASNERVFVMVSAKVRGDRELGFSTEAALLELRAPISFEGPPTIEHRHLLDLEEHGPLFPFAFALTDDAAWFAGHPFRRETMEIVSIGLRHSEDVVVTRHPAPAVLGARSSTRYDNLHDEIGATSLVEHDGLVLGTDHQGGVFGIRP